MFMVAPRGKVKLLTFFFEMPARLVTHSMVRGSVAEEDAVEKAVRIAGAMAR